MKFKGKIKGVYPDTVFAVFAIAAFIAVPVRAYQLMTNVESATGFFVDKTSITIPLLYSVLAAASIVLIIFSFICGNMPKVETPKTKSVGLSVASVFMAATLLVDAAQQLMTLLGGAAGTSVFVDLVKNKTLPLLLQAIFAALSCAYFLIYGISGFTGKQSYLKVKALSAAPVAWLMCRMIHRFIRTIGFLKVSDLMLELFMLSFLMIFFLSFARISSLINTQDKAWVLLASGYPACLFGLLCFIPRVISALLNGASVEGSPIEYVDLACVVFVLAFVVALFGKKNNPKKAAEPSMAYAAVSAPESVPAEDAEPVRRRTSEVNPRIVTSQAPASVSGTAPMFYGRPASAPVQHDSSAGRTSYLPASADYSSRAELEDLHRRAMDDEAFRIAAEYSNGGVDESLADALLRYTDSPRSDS